MTNAKIAVFLCSLSACYVLSIIAVIVTSIHFTCRFPLVDYKNGSIATTAV